MVLLRQLFSARALKAEGVLGDYHMPLLFLYRLWVGALDGRRDLLTVWV